MPRENNIHSAGIGRTDRISVEKNATATQFLPVEKRHIDNRIEFTENDLKDSECLWKWPMKNYIFIEALIFVFLIIAWRIGAISLARLGDIMIGLGILSFVIVVLSLLGIRVFTGDISVLRPLNKMVGIESMEDKPPISYILQVLGLGAIPIIIGIIFRLSS